MSDPIQRPHDPRPPQDLPPPADPVPEKRSSPLLWILLLIALVAVGWYFLSQRDTVTDAPLPDAPTIGDGTAPPAEPAPDTRDPQPTAPAAAARPADRAAAPVSPGEPGYPPAAVEAVRDWTFDPAIQAGKPVASSVRVPVEFTLDAP